MKSKKGPSVIRRDEGGPFVPGPSEVKKIDPFAVLRQRMVMCRVRAVDGPYDEFCPSLQKDLSNRVCKHCHSYFTSAASVSRHRNGCLFLFGIPVPKPTVFINEEKDVDDDPTF